MFHASFAGILADLVGHQSLTAWKGPNAIRPCVRCANLSARRSGPVSHLELGLREHDSRRFIKSSDDEIYLIIDNLDVLVNSGASKVMQLETEVGSNHDPHGILMDKSMRRIYRPSQHHRSDIYRMPNDHPTNISRTSAEDLPISTNITRKCTKT